MRCASGTLVKKPVWTLMDIESGGKMCRIAGAMKGCIRSGTKSIWALTALLVCVLSGAAVAADNDRSSWTLRIGVDPNYPPFSSIDDADLLWGFDVDIALALCASIEAKCMFVRQSWQGLIPGLLDGRFDAIVSSMSITEKRRRLVAFTDRYYSSAVRFVSARGSGFDPNSLSGQTIGAMRATIASDWLERNLPENTTLRLYANQEAMNWALSEHLLDAAFGDALGFHEWLEEEGTGFHYVGDDYYLDEGIGIALRKEDGQLRLRLNWAIQAILDDGTYARINARYFPFDLYYGGSGS